MMQVIHCANCNGSSIGLGTVSVDVTFSKHSHACEHCNSTKTETQHTFFCSTACFYAYMLKVVNGEAEMKWKDYGVGR